VDLEELTSIFFENEGNLRAFISRMIGEAEEAADLAQETFVRARAGLETFRGDAKITTWLYSIATNVCLDHLKSAGRRRLRVAPPETVAQVAGCGKEGARLTSALLLDQAEMGECVRRFIEELPHDQRMVLLLHDIEGMTNPEIASALDQSVATIKIRVHRARKRLRGVLLRNCHFTRDERGVLVCEPKPPDAASPK